jgi:hypothetical protein
MDLYRFGIDHASDVVIAGCSAGGLAVLLNIDRVRRLLPASARVRALSDAGFFIDAIDRHKTESLYDGFLRSLILRVPFLIAFPAGLLAFAGDFTRGIPLQHLMLRVYLLMATRPGGVCWLQQLRCLPSRLCFL